MSGDELTCPKSTEYCFLDGFVADTDKKKELCVPENRLCQTCYDICVSQRKCLDIKSRYRAVAKLIMTHRNLFLPCDINF